MAIKISRIGFKFALLLAGAAVLPLLAYGFISLLSLQRGTRDSIVIGNKNVATRAAEEIRRYVATNAELLKALAAELQDTGLQPWQQEQILRNYLLAFREFREITLFDESGRPLASSRVGPPQRRRSRPIRRCRSTASRCRRSASTRTCCRPASSPST